MTYGALPFSLATGAPFMTMVHTMVHTMAHTMVRTLAHTMNFMVKLHNGRDVYGVTL